jgi:Fic family protein
MTLHKKIDIAAIVLRLLKEKPEVSLGDVAEAAGLSKSNESDRKAIRRVLNKLIQEGALTFQGKARARVYQLKQPEFSDSERVSINKHDNFDEINLSAESRELLDYLAKPVLARISVGYKQDFIRSYVPNKTAYLTISQRAELQMLGEVEHVVRPAGTYARNILNRLLIDLSWNSSRLEGNTYSLLETKRLIELGETAIGKDATETQMILNHKNAIEYIVESADDKEITSRQVCDIHALLSENLLGDPSASGRLRDIGVGISGSAYLPLDNPHLLREYFDMFIQKINLIHDPFEQSFFSIVHLSYLQSFEDVNKRTARLVANIPLIKKNLRPLSFIDVNQNDYATALLGVYERNDLSLLSDLYRWAYQRSAQRYSAIQQSLGEPNLLRLKYRNLIHEIIREIVLNKVEYSQITSKITSLLELKNIPESEIREIFQIIEIEIASLHEGNIVSYKILPSEFHEWKISQLNRIDKRQK